MIGSWRDPEAEALFEGGRGHGSWQSFLRVARRKLLMLEAAKRLEDLRKPPRNMLEPLKGKRLGQHSIRINDQYRVCFRWGDDNKAYDIEIVDYHDEPRK